MESLSRGRLVWNRAFDSRVTEVDIYDIVDLLKEYASQDQCVTIALWLAYNTEALDAIKTGTDTPGKYLMDQDSPIEVDSFCSWVDAVTASATSDTDEIILLAIMVTIEELFDKTTNFFYDYVSYAISSTREAERKLRRGFPGTFAILLDTRQNSLVISSLNEDGDTFTHRKLARVAEGWTVDGGSTIHASLEAIISTAEYNLVIPFSAIEAEMSPKTKDVGAAFRFRAMEEAPETAMDSASDSEPDWDERGLVRGAKPTGKQQRAATRRDAAASALSSRNHLVTKGDTGRAGGMMSGGGRRGVHTSSDDDDNKNTNNNDSNNNKSYGRDFDRGALSTAYAYKSKYLYFPPMPEVMSSMPPEASAMAPAEGDTPHAPPPPTTTQTPTTTTASTTTTTAIPQTTTAAIPATTTTTTPAPMAPAATARSKKARISPEGSRRSEINEAEAQPRIPAAGRPMSWETGGNRAGISGGFIDSLTRRVKSIIKPKTEAEGGRAPAALPPGSTSKSIAVPPPASALSPVPERFASTLRTEATPSAPPLGGGYVLLSTSKKSEDDAISHAQAVTENRAVQEALQNTVTSPDFAQRMSELQKAVDMQASDEILEDDFFAPGMSLLEFTDETSAPAGSNSIQNELIGGQEEEDDLQAAYEAIQIAEMARLAEESNANQAWASMDGALLDAPQAQETSSTIYEPIVLPELGIDDARPSDASHYDALVTQEATLHSMKAEAMAGKESTYCELPSVDADIHTQLPTVVPPPAHEYVTLPSCSPGLPDGGEASTQTTATRAGKFLTYLPPEVAKEDQAKLSVYAPLAVAPTHRFRVMLLMYLREDELVVREIATAGGNVSRGEALRNLPVQRGALVTAALYIPRDVFAIDDSAMPVAPKPADQSLKGSKLTYLEKLESQRRRVGIGRNRTRAAPTPLPALSRSVSDAADITRRGPDARCDFIWSGQPEVVEFDLICSSDPQKFGPQTCIFKVISGQQCVKMRFILSIRPAAEAFKCVANAAAVAARIQKSSLPEAVTHMLWERGVHNILPGVADDAHTFSSISSGAVTPLPVLSKGSVGTVLDSPAQCIDAGLIEVTEINDGSLTLRPSELMLERINIPLASGAHGRVSLTSFNDGRVCVIKQPILDPVHISKQIKSFKHEGVVQRALGQHPNIVNCLGTCTDDEHMIIALEYMPLGSLRSTLESARTSGGSLVTVWNAANAKLKPVLDGPLGAKLTTSCGTAGLASYMKAAEAAISTINMHESLLRLQIARDCASGLAAMHAASFVHRDIAARNILLGLDLAPSALCSGAQSSVSIVAKVSDVGLALGMTQYAPARPTGMPSFSPALGRSASSSISIETDGYGDLQFMAPETIYYRLISAASDVYMFGGLLYELYHDDALEPWAGCSKQRIFQELFQPVSSGHVDKESIKRGLYGLLRQLTPRMRASMPTPVVELLGSCCAYEGDFSLEDDTSTDLDEVDVDRGFCPEYVYDKRPTMAQVCQVLEEAMLSYSDSPAH